MVDAGLRCLQRGLPPLFERRLVVDGGCRTGRRRLRSHVIGEFLLDAGRRLGDLLDDRVGGVSGVGVDGVLRMVVIGRRGGCGDREARGLTERRATVARGIATRMRDRDVGLARAVGGGTAAAAWSRAASISWASTPSRMPENARSTSRKVPGTSPERLDAGGSPAFALASSSSASSRVTGPYIS